MGLFDLVEEVARLRANGLEALGVCYHSASNPTNRFYVALRSPKELDSLKASYKDWDFIFNVIAC